MEQLQRLNLDDMTDKILASFVLETSESVASWSNMLPGLGWALETTFKSSWTEWYFPFHDQSTSVCEPVALH